MNERDELHRMLVEIRDRGIETARDVSWIREGMREGKERMDDQDEQIRGLQSSVNQHRGQASAFGAVAGAIFAGIVSYFTRTHT